MRTYTPRARVTGVGKRREVTDDERDRLRAEVGPLLAQAREDAGLSARQLAALIGAGAATVSRIEAGERRPRKSMLAAFAHVLDPEGTNGLLGRLQRAAGFALAPDTEPGARRRARRTRDAAIRARAELAAAATAERLADALVPHEINKLSREITAGRLSQHDPTDVAAIRAALLAAQQRADQLRQEAAVTRRRIGTTTPPAVPPRTPRLQRSNPETRA